MRKIGIIGGITPDSTTKYYEYLTSWNRTASRGMDYPVVLIYSLNLLNWYRLLEEDDEDEIVKCLIAAAESLHQAGADFAMLAANTPHMYFDRLQNESPLPLLSIVEATAKAALKEGYKRVGLLGTKFTMGKSFYPDVLSQYEIEIVVPDIKGQAYINRMLFEEVAQGQYFQSSKQQVIEITKEMKSRRMIDALILGCTELPLFLDETDVAMPVLDTVAIHAKAAIEFALK